MPEEENLENRQRGCRHDTLRQTVPSTDSSIREGPISDSGQPVTVRKRSGGVSGPRKRSCARAYRAGYDDAVTCRRSTQDLTARSSLVLSASAIADDAILIGFNIIFMYLFSK